MAAELGGVGSERVLNQVAISEPMSLPLCDRCGAVWFPMEEAARRDARGYDRERRLAGLTPLRCGKCKSPYWDENNPESPKRRKPGNPNFRGAAERSLAPTKEQGRRGRCRHGLSKCAECQG